jgi:CTD small phosphatase-like protein 2
LSKIGRDLNRTLIVDNMPQNFRLQKDNGIFIKTFYGEDRSDAALIDLIPILNEIALSNTSDVRKSLYKYREEILNKISSNISKKK